MQPNTPIYRESGVWSDVEVATPQQIMATGRMASQFGLQNPPFRRQFPPEVLKYNGRGAYAQNRLNAFGYLQPKILPPAGPTMGSWNPSSLAPQGTRSVLAGCTCQQGFSAPLTWSVSGLGSYKDMLEAPMEQIREAIEYTLQKHQQGADPQQWVAGVNALQSRMNVYIQENAWAFTNPESGRAWEAPPSRSAAKIWAGLIDILSQEPCLSDMMTLFPQIKTLRDAWIQNGDAAFAPVSPSEQAMGTVLGIGLLGLVGWGIWRSVRKRPSPPAQPLVKG